MLQPMKHTSAIMQSVDNPLVFVDSPSDLNEAQLMSLKFNGAGDEPSLIDFGSSFLLIDGSERLQVSSPDKFTEKLGISEPDAKIKVISIFGNAGDGKSHTLNRTLFGGQEVFREGGEQGPGTLGVWAAWDPVSRVLCLDTEGLQGIGDCTTPMVKPVPAGSREEQRMRLLLKILAISDVVLYRTRAERLRRDLYTFLGLASKAYTTHFSKALLRAISDRPGEGLDPPSMSSLGPALIIFHETRYTKVLESSVSESAEDIIRERFSEMQLDLNAFSSLRYVGVRAGSENRTTWSELRDAIRAAIEDSTVRAPRSPTVVLAALQALNDKFNGEIVAPAANVDCFPDQYFTCGVKCEVCNARCVKSIGHIREEMPHMSDTNKQCVFQQQYENCVYLCKVCLDRGIEVVVTSRVSAGSENSSWFEGLARYAWSGYILDCSRCGEIYRSRQFWYGNQEPEDSSVVKQVVHVWSGSLDFNKPVSNAQVSAQRVLESMAYISEAVANVTAPPTRVLSSWMADQIAPEYWRKNTDIKVCHSCQKNFEPTDTKHHCRACGEGFCDSCSQHTRPVPERGWNEPVRVCNPCFNLRASVESQDTDEQAESEVRARRYGEVVVNTISSVASAVLEYPRDLIKETARPQYWQPDCEASSCGQCEGEFTQTRGRHHCRACGKAVCGACSQHKRPVVERGWPTPVRVCDACSAP